MVNMESVHVFVVLEFMWECWLQPKVATPMQIYFGSNYFFPSIFGMLFLWIWCSQSLQRIILTPPGASHGYILMVHMNEHTLFNNVMHAHINRLFQVLDTYDN